MSHRLIVLGASNAVPSQAYDNTHLLLVAPNRMVLIDAPGSPLRRLSAAGVDPLRLTDVIVTHFHPDHVSGLPLLLMDLWLLGRTQPLHLHGLDYTIDRIAKMLDLYDWHEWPQFFPVLFHRLPERERQTLLDSPGLHISCSPMRHFIPSIGLRIEFIESQRSLAYSCDTEPCPQMVRLAVNADILIHEATGRRTGHSSPEQAGEVAAQAQAKSLILIHYPTWGGRSEDLVARAHTTFNGPVTLAEDMLQLEI